MSFFHDVVGLHLHMLGAAATKLRYSSLFFYTSTVPQRQNLRWLLLHEYGHDALIRWVQPFCLLRLAAETSISMADVDQDIFGDSDSYQSFHGFTAQELNESFPREDISVEEYSSESVYVF